jgi:hypothetical protein
LVDRSQLLTNTHLKNQIPETVFLAKYALSCQFSRDLRFAFAIIHSTHFPFRSCFSFPRALAVLHSLVLWRFSGRSCIGGFSAQLQAVASSYKHLTLRDAWVHSEDVLTFRAAREEGAIASSAFGAGFGGSVWALIAKKDVGEDPVFLAVRLMQSLTTFPHNHPCSDRTTTLAAIARPPLQRSHDHPCSDRTTTVAATARPPLQRSHDHRCSDRTTAHGLNPDRAGKHMVRTSDFARA